MEDALQTLICVGDYDNAFIIKVPRGGGLKLRVESQTEPWVWWKRKIES